METTITRKHISIRPQYLGDVKGRLRQKIEQMMVGKCTKSLGYVVGVGDDIKIIDNKIPASSSDIKYNVEFEVKTLLPQEGQWHKGLVDQIWDEGMFVTVHNLLKISMDMEDYDHDPDTNSFVVDGIKVSCGDTVNVRIDMIRYEAENFQCVGSFE